MTIGIDEVDERILYYLAREGRHTSAPDIADELDVSPPTIRNRIRRLEEANVIKGYHAHIDYEKIEGRLTNLFICTTTSADRERFARRVLDVSGVIHVKEVMTGRGDLHVIAVGTDTDEIARIARDIKALGVEIKEEDLIHRSEEHT
ncbi:MAG: Lrp/AsnC family transcriptional regulator, partial [Halobacteriaceae archaeon]